MTSPQENYAMKQPIRRLEIQINNFNVAIPHHVDLLKRHKSNIEKYQAQHDWEKVRKEHVNVARIIKQLKELLYQMETLRAQVLDADINKFDKLTGNARSNIINAIQEYFKMELNLPASEPGSPKDEDQSTYHPLSESQIKLQEEHEEIQRQQTCLHAWNSLQTDIQQLHQLFVEFNKVVDDQKESVNTVESKLEEAEVNVNEGEKFLEKASRYKVVMYPLTGAVLGTCIGGPIGLIAGLKIGGLTALGCGILGYTGGSLLKKKEITMHKAKDVPEKSPELKDLQKSSSPDDSLIETKKEL